MRWMGHARDRVTTKQHGDVEPRTAQLRNGTVKSCSDGGV
jgi:hypothetical protein